MATISSVILNVKQLRPTSSSFSDSMMMDWIIDFERIIVGEVMEKELSETLVITDTNTGTVNINDYETLSVTGAYERLYTLYVISQIDFYQQEYEAYNNSVAAFNGLYDEFRRWYIRNHTHANYRWKGVM